MKIAIDQVVGTVSPRPTSHKGGWAYLWANQLKYYFAQLGEGDVEIKVLHNEESWDGYDLIYLDHGIADQLSGAFRLERAEGGQPRLSLQASHAWAATAMLAEQLARHAYL